jgi:hypothetical protein
VWLVDSVMMDMKQRGEFLARAYKVQGELFSLLEFCRVTTSLVYGTQMAKALEAVNEVINEMKYDPKDGQAPLLHQSPYNSEKRPRSWIEHSLKESE